MSLAHAMKNYGFMSIKLTMIDLTRQKNKEAYKCTHATFVCVCVCVPFYFSTYTINEGTTFSQANEKLFANNNEN